jgi:methyl-accepting chemotaxis protein
MRIRGLQPEKEVGNTMKNLSIAARITIGFGLLLVALAIIGSITLQGLGRIDRRVDEVASHELMFFRDVSELRVHMGNLRRFEKDYFLNIANRDKRGEYLANGKTPTPRRRTR